MKKPQSRQSRQGDEKEDNELDYIEKLEKTPAGNSVRVKRYPDGSSVTYFGGMGGTLYCDENGEEC